MVIEYPTQIERDLHELHELGHMTAVEKLRVFYAQRRIFDTTLEIQKNKV